MKRLFDIFMSAILLLLFLPIGVLICILIVAESRGGVFFQQERIGQHGVSFQILKFRTMRPNSEKEGSLTVGADQRITKVGRIIRKFKLDEFPQFWNVLKGEMSIVGPRPEVKEFVDFYTEEQRQVLQVKPGITDYASVEYFEESKLLGEAEDVKKVYVEEIMPAKLKLNMRYIENPNLQADISIMWRTFLKMVGRK